MAFACMWYFWKFPNDLYPDILHNFILGMRTFWFWSRWPPNYHGGCASIALQNCKSNFSSTSWNYLISIFIMKTSAYKLWHLKDTLCRQVNIEGPHCVILTVMQCTVFTPSIRTGFFSNTTRRKLKLKDKTQAKNSWKKTQFLLKCSRVPLKMPFSLPNFS